MVFQWFLSLCLDSFVDQFRYLEIQVFDWIVIQLGNHIVEKSPHGEMFELWLLFRNYSCLRIQIAWEVVGHGCQTFRNAVLLLRFRLWLRCNIVLEILGKKDWNDISDFYSKNLCIDFTHIDLITVLDFKRIHCTLHIQPVEFLFYMSESSCQHCKTLAWILKFTKMNWTKVLIVVLYKDVSIQYRFSKMDEDEDDIVLFGMLVLSSFIWYVNSQFWHRYCT